MYWRPGLELPSPSTCLREVLRSEDTFAADPRVNVEPYEADRVVVANSSGHTVDLEPLLDPESLGYSQNADRLIRASEKSVRNTSRRQRGSRPQAPAPCSMTAMLEASQTKNMVHMQLARPIKSLQRS